MSLINKDTNQKLDQKDVLYVSNPVSQKGQKILAALYLVTEHFATTDPLRTSIRTHAITIATTPRPSIEDYFLDPSKRAIFFDALHDVAQLLDAAYLAKLITEKNYEALKVELIYYGKSVDSVKPTVSYKGHIKDNYVSRVPKPVFQDTQKGQKINSYLPEKSIIIEDNKKTDRSNQIVDFIKNKKIVSIKDIASLFPDVSEKTIQRELNRLIVLEKIKKKGNKRWSLYLALDAKE